LCAKPTIWYDRYMKQISIKPTVSFPVFSIILLLFFSFPAFAEAEEPSALLEKLYAFYETVKPLYTEGKYAEIIEATADIGKGNLVYDKMPAADKGLSEEQEVFLVVLWYKANAYYFLGQYEEAQPLYKTLIDHYPAPDGYVYGYYAKTYWEQGDSDTAFSLLNNGLSKLEDEKQKAVICWYLSSFHYEKGEYTKAIEIGEKGYEYDYTLTGPVYYEFLSHLKLNNNKEALQRLFIILDQYFYMNIMDYLPDIYDDLVLFLKENPDHKGAGTGLWLVSEAMGNRDADTFFRDIDRTLISKDLLHHTHQPHGILYYLLARYYSLTGDMRGKEECAYYCYVTGAGLVEYDGETDQYYFTREEERVPWSAENYLFQIALSTANSMKDCKKDTELVVQQGHSHCIWGLDYNREGNLLLTASLDNTIKLRRVDGRLLRTLVGHTDDVNKAVFIPNHDTIVSAGQDRSIRFWDLEGTLLKSIENAHPDNVETIAVEPDGTMIVTTSAFYKPELTPEVTFDSTANNNLMIKLWSIHGECLKTIEIEDIERANDCAYSPDGRFFVTGHGHFLLGQGDNTVRMWSPDGTLISELKEHIDAVNCVAVSPDSKTIVSGSKNGELIIWDWEDKEKKPLIIGGSPDSINDVAFSPDGRLFATVSGQFSSGEGDETVKIWTRDGKLLNIMKGHIDSVMDVAFDAGGKIIASGSKDGTVKLWSLDGSLVNTFEGNWNFLYCCAWSPEGNIIATGSNEDIIGLWETTGALYKSITPDSEYVGALDYNPDGTILASGSGDGTIRLWDREGRLLTSFKAHEYGLADMKISPDGRMILSCSFDNTVCLWDMEGTCLKNFDKFESSAEAIGFTPDSKSFAIGLKQEIVFYGLDGSEKKRIQYQDAIETLKRPFDYIRSIAFSPDGRYIAATADDTFGNGNHAVKVFDTDGRLIHDFRGHTNGINRLAFCPNSRYVASGSLDTTVRLWDVETGEAKVLEGHHDKIEDIDFSPDGRFLVSTGYDATIRIWNVETGEGFGIVSQGNEWITYSNNGFFDASRGGGEMINMVKGINAYGIDQFSAFKNRPDIILKSAGITDESTIEHYYIQYLKRLIKNDYILKDIPFHDFAAITKQVKTQADRSFLESCYRQKGKDMVTLSHKLSYQEKLALLSLSPYLACVETVLDTGYHVPRVMITGTRKDGNYVYLEFTCSDSRYNLTGYNIFVNDVPLFGTDGRQAKMRGRRIYARKRVELTAGRTKIEVSCMNSKLVESFRDLVMIDHHGQSKGDLYFIGFGTSQYRDSSLNLLYPRKDVEDLKNLFLLMEKDFNRIYTYTYTNADCTVENIQKAKSFLTNAETEDTAILFISGHGVHDSDAGATYYFLTHNADVMNLSATAANFELIEDILDNIKPREKLFLMDTCESGEIDVDYINQYISDSGMKDLKPRAILKIKERQQQKEKRPAAVKKRSYLLNKNRFIYNDIFRRTGAVVFSSSRGGEYSYEPGIYFRTGNGFFTGALIEAFTNQDTDVNRDGVISMYELKEYVTRTVSEKSGGLQNPTVDRDNLSLNLTFPIVGKK
jgi:WD40 repeat protein/tetratricopeptide (TPR) repeat protein